MPFDMHSDVILTRDVTEGGLRAGDVGTVVEHHVVPGVAEEGYSVEFFDMTGNGCRGHVAGDCPRQPIDQPFGPSAPELSNRSGSVLERVHSPAWNRRAIECNASNCHGEIQRCSISRAEAVPLQVLWPSGIRTVSRGSGHLF